MAVNRRDFRGFEIEIGPGIILKVVDVKFIGVVGGMKLASEYVHLGVINDGGMSPPRSRGGHPVLLVGEYWVPLERRVGKSKRVHIIKNSFLSIVASVDVH